MISYIAGEFYTLQSKKGKRKWIYKIRDHNYIFLVFLGINIIFSNDTVLEIHLLKLVTRKIIKSSYE